MKIEFCTKRKEFRPYRIVIETDEDSDDLNSIFKYLRYLTASEFPMDNCYKKFIEKVNNQLDELGIDYTCGYR